jgi:hypothetical protein
LTLRTWFNFLLTIQINKDKYFFVMIQRKDQKLLKDLKKIHKL